MTITPKRYRSGDQDVEIVLVEDQEMLAALRDDEWTDGHLALMSYPTAEPVAYVGAEPPLMMTGTVLRVGQCLVKGPGGDFIVLSKESVDAELTLLGARHLA